MTPGPIEPGAASRVSEGLNRAALAHHLGAVLATQRVNCVIDVGAHHGQYGVLLRRLGYREPIVSFEPIAESFAELEKVMEESPPWTGRRLALAGSTDEAEMIVYPSTDFSSLGTPTAMAPEVFPELFREVRRESVPVRRLDDAIGELDPPAPRRTLLKIDAQGSERGVLEGAAAALDEVVAIQIETSARPLYDGALTHTEALELLAAKGFELSGVFPVSRDPALRILELDLVLVKPDSGR